MKIVTIVEGHGDASAVPVLLRRIIGICARGFSVEIPHPIRIPKTKLMRVGELERAIELAARQTERGDGILVLVDSDDDCPGVVGPQLLSRAVAKRPDRRISVVLAKCEFEGWFLASAISLQGRRGLRADVAPPEDPEAVGDAKGWLAARAGGRYRETLDQPAFAAAMDLQAALTAPSFAKFVKEVESILGQRAQ